ncbi:MAG: hypothetical protein V1887_03810 [Candidatus Aenigmatarchaeota archaeon]
MADLLLPLERLGFGDILLWLLSFALVYGILNQTNMPKSKPVRGIIAIVVAFFVLLSAPASIITTLTNLSTGLLVVLLGILVVFTFLEIAGVKHLKVGKTKKIKGPDGKEYDAPAEYVQENMFTGHPKVWAAVLIIVAIVLFAGAGGLSITGLALPSGIDPMGALVMAMIALAVIWLVMEKGDEK